MSIHAILVISHSYAQTINLHFSSLQVIPVLYDIFVTLYPAIMNSFFNNQVKPTLKDLLREEGDSITQLRTKVTESSIVGDKKVILIFISSSALHSYHFLH